jgi:hypothetical protein
LHHHGRCTVSYCHLDETVAIGRASPYCEKETPGLHLTRVIVEFLDLYRGISAYLERIDRF